MVNRRKQIPSSVETQVLTESRRRCCLCFYLNEDSSQKKGQIAHLDQDPGNNALDNLAWLCFDHHDEYDGTTSQAKGLREAEVKRYRAMLHAYIREADQRRWLTSGSLEDEAEDEWQPDRISERLWTNLLEVESFPPHLYVAETDFRTPGELWESLRTIAPGVNDVPLVLKDKQILTFQNLREGPWSKVCDIGTCEEFDTEEWAESDDEQYQREFVQLLNRTLKTMLYPDVLLNKDGHYFFFRPPKNGKSKKFSYKSIQKWTVATVFQRYEKKKGEGTAFYRHHAVGAVFRRFGLKWYVQLVPTYHFTWDGVRKDVFGSERLSKKKLMDHNSTILGQVVMWAEYLRSLHKPLMPKPFELLFGHLVRLELGVGIDETHWKKPALVAADLGLFAP